MRAWIFEELKWSTHIYIYIYLQHLQEGQQHPQIHLKSPLDLQLQTKCVSGTSLSSPWICPNCLGPLPQEGHIQPTEDPKKCGKMYYRWLQVQHPWQCSEASQQTWSTLQHRCKQLHLTFFYKVTEGLVPAMPANQFLLLRSQIV